MPVFYIPAKARFQADAETALQQINDYISSNISKVTISQDRFKALEKEHVDRLAKIRELAAPRPDGALSTAYLASKVKAAVPKDAVYCIEAVTQTGIQSRSLI